MHEKETISDFENRLLTEHIDFFSPLFPNRSDFFVFLQTIVFHRGNNRPLRMLNHAKRLMNLSDQMSSHILNHKDLSILFIVSAIESVSKQSYRYIETQKQMVLIQFFEKYLSEDEQNFIRNKNKISIDNDYKYWSEITLEQFSLLLLTVRNFVVHEGIYWNMSFKMNGISQINCIESKINKDGPKIEVSYDIGITFEELREMVIKGLIRMIEHEIERTI